MPLSPKNLSKTEATSRCFGLRIESHLLQVAVATPLADGRYDIEISELECAAASGWIGPEGGRLLIEAFHSLIDRHDMRRHKVAVSLDGDFCVTRVTMGKADDVDREMSMLADRVPRYLQLGPGEKVTGVCREKIAATVDYAVTGVVNRSLIQQIYDALRLADIDVTWVEPSLISIARLIGRAQLGDEQPVMIADGTGRQWDVGIACSGRLLLDYRPASAKDEDGLRAALDGHISRLKRFCLRHRRVASGELNRVLICGNGEKPKRTVEILGNSLGVKPEVLRVPELDDLYRIAAGDRRSHNVPAVATVLPLLIGVSHGQVPDLLDEVRRAPDLPLAKRLAQTAWPLAASLLILCMSYGLVSNQRRRNADTADSRAEIQSRIAATEIKLGQLTQSRELLAHLKRIQRQTGEPDWDGIFSWITQSLPDRAKLNEYRVEDGGRILLEGTVLDESLVYELVNRFRELPGVARVALTETTPSGSEGGTRFVIRLTTSELASIAAPGAGNE